MSLKIKWALAATLLIAVALHADDFQTWTDATGKYKIEAKFIKLENNVVLLEEKDGSQSKIPLNKLRQEDQEKALNLAKAKPETVTPPGKSTETTESTKPDPSKAGEFHTWKLQSGKTIEARFVRSQGRQITLAKKDGKEIIVDQFQISPEETERLTRLMLEELEKRHDQRRERAETSTREKLKEADKGLSAQPGVTNLNFSNARQIVMAEKPWAPLDITPVPLDWQPKPTLFPPEVNHREHVSQLLISELSKLVLAVSRVNGNTDAGTVTRFIVANASTGKYQRDYLVSGDYRALAFGPDGKSLLVQKHLIGNLASEVELWHLTPKGIERISRWSFTVGKDDFHSVGNAETAHFLANGTRALITTDHYFFVVDIEAGKPIFYGKLSNKAMPAISPDERFLFGAFLEHLFAVDLASGELHGMLRVDKKSLLMGGPLAVSPDGTRLAHKVTGEIVLYDLKTGQESYRLPSSPLGKLFSWTGPDSIMAGGDGNRLVYFDTVLNYPIWEIREVEHVAFVGSHGMFYVEDRNERRGLVVSALPHASATKVVDQARKDPNFFIVKPGTRFRVDASSIQDPRLQQQSKAVIEKRITECGHVVDGNARLTVHLEISREEDFDMTYRSRFGAPNAKIEEHKVKIPRWHYYVTIKAGANDLWTKQNYELPPLSIFVTNEKPLAQQISQFSTPNADIFKKFLIPQFVPRDARADYSVQPLHKSEITINGIK